MTSVAKSAFAGCTGLKSVVIGKNVESISAGAFEGCTGIKEIRFLHASDEMPRILIGFNPELDGAEVVYEESESEDYNAPKKYFKTGEITLW